MKENSIRIVGHNHPYQYINAYNEGKHQPLKGCPRALKPVSEYGESTGQTIISSNWQATGHSHTK